MDAARVDPCTCVHNEIITQHYILAKISLVLIQNQLQHAMCICILQSLVLSDATYQVSRNDPPKDVSTNRLSKGQSSDMSKRLRTASYHVPRRCQSWFCSRGVRCILCTSAGLCPCRYWRTETACWSHWRWWGQFHSHTEHLTRRPSSSGQTFSSWKSPGRTKARDQPRIANLQQVK